MPWRLLLDRSTYRGWGWLIVGAALLMPYMMAGAVVQQLVDDAPGYGNVLLFAQLPVFLAVLPVVALTGLVLPVRAPSVQLARILLGTSIPEVAAVRDWPRRGRDAAWFTLHLGMGALLSGITLALVPFAVFIATLPLTADRELSQRYLDIGDGWSPWWGPLWGFLLVVALIYLIAGATRLARWCAPRLLGPTVSEQVSIARDRARELAVRNRLARELHDSVGHALSVVTIQAAAASRTLRRDPDFARGAMDSVADTARRALADLDTVLGLLRADGTDDAVAVRTLDDLSELFSSCGLTVEADVPGALDVPAVISREAYRLVQESLTNALKHGADATARVKIDVDADRLLLEVSNPLRLDAAPAQPGRGIAGMSERVTILGGQIKRGAWSGRWYVTVRLPVGSAP